MPSTAQLPPTFGRFQITRKLGEGGMGAVYLAWDTKMERPVALKVPHLTDNPDQDLIKRFQREARIACAIQHPNLCQIFEADQIGDIHFLIMPFIEGESLSALLKKSPPWEAGRAAQMIGPVALALAELHERGIVHRDLKPANIMIKKSGTPVLMDFGLARAFTEESGRFTAPGGVVGTAGYMSPEQINGEGTLGPATDIWSLGVILYEMVTGVLPFEGPFMIMFHQILNRHARLPSSRCATVDAEFDALCLRAMAKKPENRFADMRDLEGHLRDYAQRHGFAGPPSRPEADFSPVSDAPEEEAKQTRTDNSSPAAPTPISMQKLKRSNSTQNPKVVERASTCCGQYRSEGQNPRYSRRAFRGARRFLARQIFCVSFGGAQRVRTGKTSPRPGLPRHPPPSIGVRGEKEDGLRSRSRPVAALVKRAGE